MLPYLAEKPPNAVDFYHFLAGSASVLRHRQILPGRRPNRGLSVRLSSTDKSDEDDRMSQHFHTAPMTDPDDTAPAAFEFDGQVGAALHHRRRRLGLTATQLARRVGITQRRMARLELGLEPLTLRLALSLGAALDMPVGWFLGVEAAAVPEAIGISLRQAHDDWTQALALRIAALGAAPMQH
jgi:transcriptional regulator with XRE-family HTH domain